MKTISRTICSAFLLFVFASLALLSQVQAVVPAPDGCYPNFTTAEGCNALNSLTTGAGNTAVGWRSLFLNTIGSFNTGVGAGVLVLNTGDSNTGVGAAALLLNTIGTQNVAVGTAALVSNTTGNGNTANGFDALFSNTTGNFNTANGIAALPTNTAGSGNSANGFDALASNTTGSNNTAVGINALFGDMTGSNNIGLGNDAGVNVTTANSVICIGTDGNNVDNSCYINNIFNATSSGGTAVYVNINGRLGSSTSSRRFKEDIRPMDHASETLFSLKPVTFHYKKGVDPEASERKSEFGLVAEDVENVNPDLVVRDKQGKPYSVRYDQVNAMLLNEFLKEHYKTEKLEATVARQQKQLETVTATLQKVSAQLAAASPSLADLK